MKTKKIIKEILLTACDILIAVLFGWLITHYVFVNTEVPTGSMLPTIDEEALLISSKISYSFSEPKRSDIIVFAHPDGEDMLLIKRIVGMPGDKIEGKQGNVYINDTKLDESNYLDKSVITSDFGPYTVPENYYFVMGDNRTYSLDARYWDNKFVSKDDIIAKAIFQYKPKFRKLN